MAKTSSAMDAHKCFPGGPVKIEPGTCHLGLNDVLSVEWKNADVPAGGEGVTARMTEVDDVECLEIKTPVTDGWVRLCCDIDRVSTQSLLAVRMLVRVTGDGPAEKCTLRSSLSRTKTSIGRRTGIAESAVNINAASGNWQEVWGVFLCGVEQEGWRIDLMVNLPEESVITFAAIDTYWFDADISQSLATVLKEEPVVSILPFKYHELKPKKLAGRTQSPAIFTSHSSISGLDVQGWLLTEADGEMVRLSANGKSVMVPVDKTVPIAEGVSVKCGFEASLTHLLGGSDSSLVCSLAGTPEYGFSEVALPAALRRLQTDEDEGDEVAEEIDAPVVDTKLFFFPDYSITNPYQTLMYRSMPTAASQPGTIDDAISELERPDAPNRVVMHLHWLNPLLAGAKTPAQAESMRRAFCDKLAYFIHLGGIVLWTVHNTVSHDAKFYDTERKLGQNVADLASKIHVHSATLLEELSEYYDLSEDKLVIQPHPNYVSHYPNYVSREASRRRLGLDENAKVFLFLGQLRPYKGIERLVRDFAAVQKKEPNAHLLIVGSPVFPYSAGTLKRKYQGYKNVQVIEGHVSNETMQWYYNACDFVVMPYKKILTSGSLLCAMSFSRPVIAPVMGMIPDLLKEGKSGFSFKPEDPEGLTKAMMKAAATTPAKAEEMQKKAFSTVEPLTWKKMGTALTKAIAQSHCFSLVKIPFDDGDRDCILMGQKFPPKKPARTAVIILNYEHVDDVQRLIGTLNDSTTQDFDIYVVDNYSPSLSEFDVAASFPSVHVLRLPSNLGYAAGNNAAMRLIRGLPYEFIWILNPDMEVTPEALEQHVQAAEEHKNISLFGGIICRGDDKKRVASAGGYISFEDGMSTGQMYAGEQVSVLPKEPYTVDFVTGASVFLRKPVLDKIGYIPEDYFLYFEETHWLIEASRKGEPCMVLPNVLLAHHKRSEEGGLPAKYYFYYYLRNSLVFASRIGGEHPNITTSRLQSGFISAWLGKIEQRAPAKLALYTKLAEQALADGREDRTGRIDLIDLELSTEALPEMRDGDLVACTARIDDEAQISGVVHLSRPVPYSCVISIVSAEKIIAQVTCKKAGNEQAEQFFSHKLPLPFRDGKPRTYDFYVNRSLEADARIVKRLPRPAPEYKGRIDGLRQYCCAGWVWNKNDPEEKVMVELLHNGEVIGRGIADIFRQDLLKNSIGDGCAAFNIRLPKKFSSGQKYRIQMRIAGETEMLFERDVIDGEIQGGATLMPPKDALESLFYKRHFWLAKHDLEELPVGRYMKMVQDRLIAKHEGQAQDAKVSVIMPAFNREETIVSAIESVRGQTYENWELLVVDDGSSDSTVKTVQALMDETGDERIKLIVMPRNVGVSAARNAGLKQAEGEMIAYLDSDNIWYPEFLSVMAGELLNSVDKAPAAYCGQRIVQVYGFEDEKHEELIAIRTGEFHLPLMENRNFIDLNCYVHRRSMFEKHGGFNETMRRLVDWEMILRYARVSPPLYVPVLLSNYYFDRADNQITKLENYVDSFELLKQSADRDAASQDVAAVKELRPVDMALICPDFKDGDALRQRITELLASVRDETDLRVLVHADPAVSEELQDMTSDKVEFVVLEEDGSGKPVQAGAYISDAFSRRRAEADIVLVNETVFLTQGWLEAYNEAMAEAADGGIFISRFTVKGNDPNALTHQPFASRERDICIALSDRQRNVVDPSLNRKLGLVEVSGFTPFCTYFRRESAEHLVSLDASDLDQGKAYAQIITFVRDYLHQKVVYCSRVNAYQLPAIGEG
ncbi:glycosyltransferase [Aquisalinus luteolus]|uniref:glycosyltransferase n=1 Tax=Aquisalinus luteolus TaxID=1566827 RepID=UPI00197E9BD4|nr:glycosyltransferase [Aquisalinus luteolus]